MGLWVYGIANSGIMGLRILELTTRSARDTEDTEVFYLLSTDYTDYFYYKGIGPECNKKEKLLQ